nr:phosphatase PAP2 family protein [Kocuria sp. JC486]
MLPVIVCVFWGVLTLIFALAARRWRPLLVGLVSGLGAVVTVQLLKREFLHKAQLGIQESAMNSLPSGHTAAAAVAAMIAVMVAPARGRTVVAFLGALTTTLAGVATVLNSWHRPMDAVVSILVVACWGILGALLLRCLIRPERWRASRALGSLILGILALAAAAAGMAAMQTVAIDGLALATGGAAILGVSLVCAHQTARALRPRHRAG